MVNNIGEIYEMIIGAIPSYLNQYYMGTLNQPTFFVRATVCSEIRFNNYKIGMDFDWVLRAIKAGYKFRKISDNIVFYVMMVTQNKIF